jgi:hypothetical protein
MEKKQAKLTYDKFSKIDGNQHIAGQFAIESILKIVDTFNINSILEIGLGIGSISDAVLNYSKQKNKKITYVGTEANEFCLNALKTNVANYSQLVVCNSITDIPNTNKFDLIIIDGLDNDLEKIAKHINKEAFLFIEGDRSNQVSLINKKFPNLLFVSMVSSYKNSINGPFSSDHWSGGGSFFILNPNFKSKTFWLIQKIKTKLARRKRKLNK